MEGNVKLEEMNIFSKHKKEVFRSEVEINKRLTEQRLSVGYRAK